MVHVSFLSLLSSSINYLILKLNYTAQKKLLLNLKKIKLNKRGVSFFGECNLFDKYLNIFQTTVVMSPGGGGPVIAPAGGPVAIISDQTGMYGQNLITHSNFTSEMAQQIKHNYSLIDKVLIKCIRFKMCVLKCFLLF